MPNVWTHILFGENTAEKAGYVLPSDDVKPYFRLGTQGPDPLFYYHFWPWKKEKSVPAIASRIHRQSCGPFLMEMIRFGFRNASDFYLQAYILGFLTHYLLDRNTHPYIIYRSGTREYNHQKLEIMIDTLLMEEWYGLKTWKTPVYKEIDIGRHLYEPIEDMLVLLIEKFFPDEAAGLPPDYVDQSYQDMIKALKFLHDPLGWKNRAFKEQVSAFSYKKIEDDRDYLNRGRTIWLHPADDREQHEESFDDLMKKAEREGVRILAAVLDYWKSGEESGYEGIEKELGNLAYDSGKDCSLSCEMKHFDSIL